MLDRGEKVLSEYQNLNLPYISNKNGSTGIQVDVDSVKQKRTFKKLNQPSFNTLANRTANTNNANTNLISPRFSTYDPSQPSILKQRSKELRFKDTSYN